MNGLVIGLVVFIGSERSWVHVGENTSCLAMNQLK